MAPTLGLSRSGYYAARKRPPSRRQQENEALVAEMQVIQGQFRGVYGSPRMLRELLDRGFSCSRNRVMRLMQQNNIAAKTKRKFKVTTRSKHTFSVAPNLLGQNFAAERPDQIWTSDISYIPTDEGWLYLAKVKDLFTKTVVGWAAGERPDRSLVMDAFRRSVQRRKPQPGLIFHSDRGVQYACSDFRELLVKHGAVQSMSGKGNCYDNAPSESFFGTLKTEMVYFEHFRTREEAKSALFDYIEVFYNRQRRHSAIAYQSPAEFERRWRLTAVPCPADVIGEIRQAVVLPA